MTIDDYKFNFADTVNCYLTQAADWQYDDVDDLIFKVIPKPIVKVMGKNIPAIKTFYQTAKPDDSIKFTFDGRSFTLKRIYDYYEVYYKE